MWAQVDKTSTAASKLSCLQTARLARPNGKNEVKLYMPKQDLLARFKALDVCYSYLHMTSDESEIEYTTKKDTMDSDCEKALENGNYMLIQTELLRRCRTTKQKIRR